MSNGPVRSSRASQRSNRAASNTHLLRWATAAVKVMTVMFVVGIALIETVSPLSLVTRLVLYALDATVGLAAWFAMDRRYKRSLARGDEHEPK